MRPLLIASNRGRLLFQDWTCCPSSNKWNRGSQFEHIRIRNLVFGDLADVPENARKLNMIDVTTNYDSAGVRYNRNPTFKDIRLENIKGGTSRFPVKLEGTPASLLRDFVLDNVHLGAEEEQIVSLTQNDSITFSGDAIDVDGDELSYQWEAVAGISPDSAEPGSDSIGKIVCGRFQLLANKQQLTPLQSM